MSRLLKDDPEADQGVPAGHGNAGLASNFLDLAHAKVQAGRRRSRLVMPLSLLQGGAHGPPSRDAAADALRADDRHRAWRLPAATIAKSFSADTGMGEVLVVACHRRDSSASAAAEPRVTFVALRKRPTSPSKRSGS